MTEKRGVNSFEYTKEYNPNYYVAQHGYDATKDLEAYRVIDAFGLNHNFGAAFTYMVRAYQKHEHPISDIKKAIRHLELQLELEEGKLQIETASVE
ncbi:hypothetical protein JDW15_04305 [Aerococcaceae bacterium zg-ZJ1578]|uniref:hypothetical protein n=1 Tax=Aerococcaceae bacterium zg-252 TaxID=2796928 RepID=UPI001A344C9C|nr:hypothetical protein [Aerococcaceae bacterium zg-1578]